VKPYILVVVDNKHDVDRMRKAFAAIRVLRAVVVLTDGVQACEFLFGADGDGGGYPEVILLDWQLQKISGRRVLERIRFGGRTHLIPTVVLVSGEHDEHTSDAYRLGANGCVRKPKDFDEFVDTVRQLALYWLVLNESSPDAVAAGSDGTATAWGSEKRAAV